MGGFCSIRSACAYNQRCACTQIVAYVLLSTEVRVTQITLNIRSSYYKLLSRVKGGMYKGLAYRKYNTSHSLFRSWNTNHHASIVKQQKNRQTFVRSMTMWINQRNLRLVIKEGVYTGCQLWYAWVFSSFWGWGCWISCLMGTVVGQRGWFPLCVTTSSNPIPIVIRYILVPIL